LSGREGSGWIRGWWGWGGDDGVSWGGRWRVVGWGLGGGPGSLERRFTGAEELSGVANGTVARTPSEP